MASKSARVGDRYSHLSTVRAKAGIRSARSKRAPKEYRPAVTMPHPRPTRAKITGPRMARIMVHPGGKKQLPTYAGISYFYNMRDYRRHVLPLVASGTIPQSGIISPQELKQIVGKPFSSRYGQQWERNYA